MGLPPMRLASRVSPVKPEPKLMLLILFQNMRLGASDEAVKRRLSLIMKMGLKP